MSVVKLVNLDLKDRGVVPIISVPRYDSGLRTLEFHLFDGDSVYAIPSNASVTMRGTKPDRNGFVYSCSTNNSAGIVSINCTTQMTAVLGDVYCQVVIIDTSGKRVASFVFILKVEKASIDDGTVISDSDLAYVVEVLDKIQISGTLMEQFERLANDFQTLQNDNNAFKTQVNNTVANMNTDLTALRTDYMHYKETVHFNMRYVASEQQIYLN